jgi:hypothetical protein
MPCLQYPNRSRRVDEPQAIGEDDAIAPAAMSGREGERIE